MTAQEKPFEFVKNKKFEIPRYQRRYVWDTDNWERLLDEWEYGIDKSHFLGSIIINNFYTLSTSDEQKRMQIVDGQQRLLTLTILYKVIFDLFSNDERLEWNKTKNSILGEQNDLILVSHLDEKDYKSVMNKNVDVDSINLEDIGRGKKKILKSSNILRCYKYFFERLSKPEELNNRRQLWDELNNSNKIIFVVVDVNEKDDAQQIFDCINSAGVKLSLSELVKNKLMSQLSKSNNRKTEDDDYTAYWKETFEDSSEIDSYWSEVKSIGKYKRTNLDIFLYCFAIIKGFFNIDDRMSKLYNSYYKKIESFNNNRELIISFANELNRCANIYKENIVNDYSSFLYDYNNKIGLTLLALEKLDCTTFYPYCLKLLVDDTISKKSKEDNFSTLLKLILRVAICNDLTTSKNYNNYCFKLATDDTFTIQQYYKDRLDNGVAINNDSIAKGLSCISNKNANLLLFLLELFLRQDKDMNGQDKLYYVYTLEHIMPQKYQKNYSFSVVPVRAYNETTNQYEDFTGTDDEKQQYRESAIYEIGNMILLTKSLNSKEQNESLKKKMPLYNERCKNLIIDNQFIQSISKDIWNEETIHNRTEKLIDSILKNII